MKCTAWFLNSSKATCTLSWLLCNKGTLGSLQACVLHSSVAKRQCTARLRSRWHIFSSPNLIATTSDPALNVVGHSMYGISLDLKPHLLDSSIPHLHTMKLLPPPPPRSGGGGNPQSHS